MDENEELGGIESEELRRLLDQFNAADEAVESAKARLAQCEHAQLSIGHEINLLLLRMPARGRRGIVYQGRLYSPIEGSIRFSYVTQL